MLIVADEMILYAREAFGALGELRLLPSAAITPEAVADADVLLVRSVTPIDARFAQLPRLRFVGTATIGTDHIDVAALRARGIAVEHAPGCNSDSVVEYVLAALLELAVRQRVGLRERTVGIVGCGSIGSRLARRLPALGLRVLCNDPPLAERLAADGLPQSFVSLERVLAESDVLTLHVPITRDGPHPTHHLIDAAELAALRPDAWLLNSARGAVVSNAALLAAIERGEPGAVVLDVWENEPQLDPALLRRADLATPHIAGHSFDGKVAGTIMLRAALERELGLNTEWDAEAALAPNSEDRLELTAPRVPVPRDAAQEAAWLHALVRQMYDITADDQRMRTLLECSAAELPRAFQAQRRCYPRRRTFARYSLRGDAVPDRLIEAVRDGLGVRLT